MIEEFLIQNVWAVMVLWTLVYLSDYYLTIYSARELTGRMRQHMQHEGSLELTPQYQKDVDALKLFSPRFFRNLLIMLALIWAIFTLSSYLEEYFGYLFFIGGFFLVEAAVHMRHLRNLALVIFSRQPGSLRGMLEQSRWLMLRLSAAELLSFGLLYLLIALVAGSWFFFGGGVITAITGWKHWSMTRKLKPALPVPET